MKATKILIILFLTLYMADCFAQQTQGKWFANINTLSFFKDNEYNSERLNGYTLPGFRLTPTIDYSLDIFSLSIGIDALHYWGKSQYPAYAYSSLADINKTQKTQQQAHITPFFRASIQYKNLSFVIGDVYADNYHNMITPLYTHELTLTSDREVGIQALYNSKYFEADTWVDWKNFIFINENQREVMYVGSSERVYIVNDNNFKLYLPFQMIFRHRGGEFDTIASNESLVNYSLGLGAKYSFNSKSNSQFAPKSLCAEFHYVGFKRNTTLGAPYRSGSGFFPSLSVQSKATKIALSYWEAKDFVSLLGNGLFNSLSSVTPDLLYDRVQCFLLQGEYNFYYTPEYAFGAELNFFYFLNSTGNRPGYAKVVRNGFNCFSFGFYLKINPQIRL
jgi:hypothetical protein